FSFSDALTQDASGHVIPISEAAERRASPSQRIEPLEPAGAAGSRRVAEIVSVVHRPLNLAAIERLVAPAARTFGIGDAASLGADLAYGIPVDAEGPEGEMDARGGRIAGDDLAAAIGEQPGLAAAQSVEHVVG